MQIIISDYFTRKSFSFEKIEVIQQISVNIGHDLLLDEHQLNATYIQLH